jgi:hypothetical protein
MGYIHPLAGNFSAQMNNGMNDQNYMYGNTNNYGYMNQTTNQNWNNLNNGWQGNP